MILTAQRVRVKRKQGYLVAYKAKLVYLCICVLMYLCIRVVVYLCICVLVYLRSCVLVFGVLVYLCLVIKDQRNKQQWARTLVPKLFPSSTNSAM